MDYEFSRIRGIFIRVANPMLYGYLIPGVKLTDKSWITPNAFRYLWAGWLATLSVTFFIMQALSTQFARDGVGMTNAFAMGFAGLIFLVRIWVLAASPSHVRDAFFLDFATFKCNQYRPRRSLRILREGYKHVEQVFKVCQLAAAMNVMSWMFFPLLPLIFLYCSGASYAEISKHLPTSIMVETNWGYPELRYAYELVMAVSLVECWTSSTALYYAIIHMIHVQYLALADSIKKLRIGKDSEPCDPICIKYFVEDQLKLRQISMEFSDHLSPLLAVTLVNAGFSITLNLTSLIQQSENSSETGIIATYIKFVVFFVVTVSEITLYCVMSEKLNASNSYMATTIYEANWLSDHGEPSKHNWLLPMVVCQREIRLCASKMVPLRIRTAVEIMKFSYSYCAILTNTNNK